MGFYGMGQANNLRYMPRQQVGFGRPPRAPRPPMPGGGNYCSTTNIAYEGPSAGASFWGGFVGASLGGLFNFFANKAQAKRQGMQELMQAQMTMQPTQNAQQSRSIDKLSNLKQMYSNYTVIQNGDDNFTVTDGKGKNIKTGTYDELIKGLNTQEVQPQGEIQPQQQVQPQQQTQPQQQVSNTPTTTRSQGSRQRDISSSTQTQTLKGDIIHKTADGDVMTKEVKNGRTEYHFYQFDKKTGKYTDMDESEFRSKHNTKDKQVNITALKNGSYTTKAQKEGQRIKGQQGRYAEQNPKTGEWNFYAHDGVKLKPEYVKQKDPQLYNSTIGQQQQA